MKKFNNALSVIKSIENQFGIQTSHKWLDLARQAGILFVFNLVLTSVLFIAAAISIIRGSRLLGLDPGKVDEDHYLKLLWMVTAITTAVDFNLPIVRQYSQAASDDNPMLTDRTNPLVKQQRAYRQHALLVKRLLWVGARVAAACCVFGLPYAMQFVLRGRRFRSTLPGKSYNVDPSNYNYMGETEYNFFNSNTMTQVILILMANFLSMFIVISSRWCKYDSENVRISLIRNDMQLMLNNSFYQMKSTSSWTLLPMSMLALQLDHINSFFNEEDLLRLDEMRKMFPQLVVAYSQPSAYIFQCSDAENFLGELQANAEQFFIFMTSFERLYKSYFRIKHIVIASLISDPRVLNSFMLHIELNVKEQRTHINSLHAWLLEKVQEFTVLDQKSVISFTINSVTADFTQQLLQHLKSLQENTAVLTSQSTPAPRVKRVKKLATTTQPILDQRLPPVIMRSQPIEWQVKGGVRRVAEPLINLTAPCEDVWTVENSQNGMVLFCMLSSAILDGCCKDKFEPNYLELILACTVHRHVVVGLGKTGYKYSGKEAHGAPWKYKVVHKKGGNSQLRLLFYPVVAQNGYLLYEARGFSCRH